MAPSQPRKPAAGKSTTSRATTKTPAGKSSTKPKDKNRVVKPFKPETGKGSYSDKAVEARRAKDAPIVDKFAEDAKRHQKLLERGPNGRPNYDTQGFELDYEKVKKSSRPISKQRRGSKAYMKMLEKEASERSTIENLMGLPEGGFSGAVRWKVQDRVARDLGVPYHKVSMYHYGEWEALGFRPDSEEFKLENISEEEKQRLLDLTTGSALRK